MEIIIPANRIEGDINSQVIVDNEITSVSVVNYNITKKTIENLEQIDSEPISSSSKLKDTDYDYTKNIFYVNASRAELYVTSGEIQIKTTKNINNINNTDCLVSGVVKNSSFNYESYSEKIRDKSNWVGEETNEKLLQYANSFKETSFQDKHFTLLKKDIGYSFVHYSDFIKIKSIKVVNNEYVIDIAFTVCTEFRGYHFWNTSGFKPYKNEIEFVVANSFIIRLDTEIIETETNSTLANSYGEGVKVLSYKTNELFQLENTYNDGEKEVPIGEFVANQVIAMYKNGRKTATMTALTDNLLVSDNKLENGHYGVYGRLERQIYKVGDNVIPYKVDKSLKELPNSEYLGVPQSFKVAENEVRYEGKLTQNLTTQENTYFNIYYDENLFSVYRNGIVVGSGDRTFREEELSVGLQMPYDKNNIFLLGYDDVLTSYQQDSEDTTKYKPINVNVNGFLNLNLYQKVFSLISSPNSYADTSSLAGFGEGSYRGLTYNAISSFDKNETHKILVDIETKNSNGQTYTEEIEVVLNDDKSTIVNVGRNKSVEIIFYKMESDNICTLYFTNSSTERLTYITLRAIYQTSTTQIA